MIPSPALSIGDAITVDLDGLEQLIVALRRRGYRTIGPTVRDGAIVLREIDGVDSLPRGWHDKQAPGSYQIEDQGDQAVFGWAVGPQSMKSQVFPPVATLWRAKVGDDGALTFAAEPEMPRPIALFAARPCEVAAIRVLDGVLAAPATTDTSYLARRHGIFLVAAECGSPSGTCFCTSMGTGPSADADHDLALTEILEGDHRFLLRIGSAKGAEVASEIDHRPARAEDLEARAKVLAGAEARMGRNLETSDLPALLARNLDNPRWDEVATRCLACGNCTMVCPTCFCSDIDDTSDLDGNITRTRTWASCFDLQHSYMHGGPLRVSTKSRYRQWITHKLSTWHDQFGTSGCVGCGRCITWCPVGIDITAEAAAIRASESERQVPDART